MRYQLADFPQYKYGEEDCVISWLWRGRLRYQLQLAELEFPLSEFPLSAPRKLVSGNLCTPSLNRKNWNEVLGSAFVNISATCKDDRRKRVIKTPLATFSRTK